MKAPRSNSDPASTPAESEQWVATIGPSARSEPPVSRADPPPFVAERPRTQLSRVGSSLPPGSSLSASVDLDPSQRELLSRLRQLRQRCRDVATLFEGLGALRSMGGEEALIEMALFAQNHEHTLDEMWGALRDCEDAALSLCGPPDSSIDRDAPTPLPPAMAARRESAGAPVADSALTRPVPAPPAPVPLIEGDDDSPITQVDLTPSRVLVVDDDPAVLRAFRRVLSGTHEVLTARDGSEALRVVLGDQPVDAIICDIGMPKLDGPAFFSELFELKPQLMPRVVFCTGGVPSDSVQRFLERMQAPVLHKPVAAEELLSAVETVRGP